MKVKFKYDRKAYKILSISTVTSFLNTYCRLNVPSFIKVRQYWLANTIKYKPILKQCQLCWSTKYKVNLIVKRPWMRFIDLSVSGRTLYTYM